MLLGERLRVRAIERDDMPHFVRWFNDPEVRHFLLMYMPMSLAEEERWFENILDTKDMFFFVIEALHRRAVAHASIKERNGSARAVSTDNGNATDMATRPQQ